jgi:dCTP deaminase
MIEPCSEKKVGAGVISCGLSSYGHDLRVSDEYFRNPADVLTICAGKSTYARRGVIVTVTPFKPD